MSRVVYLHVGAPKTGTTYLQDRMVRNAAALARHGVHMPTGSRWVPADLFQFRAALDVLGQDWGGAPGHARGAWDRLVGRVRRLDGTVLISHEILAPAPPERIARVLGDLADAETHVVYTVRDLGRQVPAAWQESVKQGRAWRFRGFVNRLRQQRTWFFHAFDVPTVLGAWGASLPPERVHVVVVPQPGAPSGELWRRFCGALGIDPAWAPMDSSRRNRSLGVVETDLLRRLNRRLGRQARREEQYDELIRELLAHQELASRSSPRVRLGPEHLPWAREVTDAWVRWIRDQGVSVWGDLTDLTVPDPPADEPWVDPDRVRAKPVLAAAVAALDAMTREAASRPDPGQRLPVRLRSRLASMRWSSGAGA